MTAEAWYAGRGNCGGTPTSVAVADGDEARKDVWTYVVAEAAAREEDGRLGNVDGAADRGDAEIR